MTDQESAIYDYLNSGDHSAINDMRNDFEADNIEGLKQFEVDYRNAYARYQADHEMPEEEREQATAELVKLENQEAPTEEV